MAGELKKIMSEGGPASPSGDQQPLPEYRSGRRRAAIIASVVAVAVLLVAAGVGYLLFPEAPEDEQAPAVPSSPEVKTGEIVEQVRPPLTETERREVEQAIRDLEELRLRLEEREIQESIDAGELAPLPSSGK